MKKIALCLYGRFNNRLSSTSGLEGTEYIKTNIIKNHNVDVFIHSWDLENETIINKSYNSLIKKAVFEPQIQFMPKILEAGIDIDSFDAPGGQKFRTLDNTFSFLYSRAQSIELKKSYEQLNSFKYDIVVCSRFDLGQIDKFNGFQEYKVSEIDFNTDLDMNYIYSAMWNLFNEGFTDMWFYSSSELMDKLIDMYQLSYGYFKANSNYINALSKGWPDSNAENIFSNEVFKSNKTTNLMKYSPREAQNNHFLHKWYFIDQNLYEKCRFLPKVNSKICLIVIHNDENEKSAWFKAFGTHGLTFSEIVYIQNNDTIKTTITQALLDMKSRGVQIVMTTHASEVLNKDINFYNLKNALNIVWKSNSGKPLRNGLDCVFFENESSLIQIPHYNYRLLKRWFPFLNKIKKATPSIWKIEKLISIQKRNPAFLIRAMSRSQMQASLLLKKVRFGNIQFTYQTTNQNSHS